MRRSSILEPTITTKKKPRRSGPAESLPMRRCGGSWVGGSVRKGWWKGAGAARQVGCILRQALSLAHLSGRVADKATLGDIAGRLLVGDPSAEVC